MPYVYHFHGIQQNRVGETTNVDGILRMERKIMTGDSYKAVKEFIATDMKLPNNGAGLCLTALTFLHIDDTVE